MDQNMLNLIQGVMGQVMGVLGGGQGSNSGLTVAQFLNTLPDYTYEAGESLVTDLLMTLASHLTFQDMVAIVGRSPSPATLAGLQEPLQQFIRQRLLAGAEPTQQNVELAVLNMLDDFHPQLVEASSVASVRRNISLPETLHNFLSRRPLSMVMMVLTRDSQTFVASLGPQLKAILEELAALCLHCFTDSTVSLERVLEDRLGALTEDVGPGIRDWTVSSALSHLRSFTQSSDFPSGEDVESWVISSDQASERETLRAGRLAARQEQGVTEPPPEQMEVESQAIPPASEAVGGRAAPQTVPQALGGRVAPKTVPEVGQDPIFPQALLAVPLATQPSPPGALGGVPADWVPIITRDMAGVGRLGRQGPFSEAYLAGQPSKRRKLNSEKKPRGDVNSVIAQSLQEAIDQSGLEPNTDSSRVVAEVAGDQRVQRAVEMVTRGAIQDRTETNRDFQADRFPAVHNFRKNQ